MTFLAPLYLLTLIPFAAFALWLLIGRRRRTWVPYLPLWNAPEELRRPKKGFEPPPLALVLALIALLLGLLAISQPHLASAGQSFDRGRITLIVDRGDSMSAKSNSQPRFASLAEQVAPKLLDHLGQGSVDLIDVVTNSVQQTNRSAWQSEVQKWKRTAIDTTQPLKTIIQQRLLTGNPVIVLSDRDLGISQDQFLQIKPSATVRNVAIIALAHRPKQIMATLRATEATTRTLTIRSGDQSAQATVKLQPNIDQNVFIDLDAKSDTIEASLDTPDDFDADDRAWLTRQQSSPAIEARVALPDDIRRVMEVYTRHRPVTDSSPKLPIVRPGELKADEPGIFLAQATGPELAKGEVTTQPHPILNGISDWSALTKSVAIAPAPPGQDWKKILSINNQPLIAVKEGETRQVWIGFESREFSRTPAFVILWTNLFDWTGGGVEAFTSSPVIQATGERLAPEKLPQDVDPDYWPGVFQTAQTKTAQNAASTHFAYSNEDWPSQLSSLHLKPIASIDPAPWLAILALFCLLGAAATWEMRRRATIGTALNRAVA